MLRYWMKWLLVGYGVEERITDRCHCSHWKAMKCWATTENRLQYSSVRDAGDYWIRQETGEPGTFRQYGEHSLMAPRWW